MTFYKHILQKNVNQPSKNSARNELETITFRPELFNFYGLKIIQSKTGQIFIHENDKFSSL